MILQLITPPPPPPPPPPNTSDFYPFHKLEDFNGKSVTQQMTDALYP